MQLTLSVVLSVVLTSRHITYKGVLELAYQYLKGLAADRVQMQAEIACTFAQHTCVSLQPDTTGNRIYYLLKPVNE